jgi:putative membrane protein
MNFLTKLLIKWVVFALAIMFTGWLIAGVAISDFWTAMVAALAMSLINIGIKPILMLLAMPINMMSLGLFSLVINALLFMFVAYIVPGVTVDGFISAFLGALLLSVLSIGISWL